MAWWAVHLDIMRWAPDVEDPKAAVTTALAHLQPAVSHRGGSMIVGVSSDSAEYAELYVLDVLDREGVGTLAKITGVTALPKAGIGAHRHR